MRSNTYDIVTQTLKELTAPYGVYETSWYFVFKGSELMRYKTFCCISTPYAEYNSALKVLTLNNKDYKVNTDYICDNLKKQVFLLATHKWRAWE